MPSPRSKTKLSPAAVSSAIGIALVAGIGGWFLWANHARTAARAAAETAAYAVSGPPCPTRTAEDLELKGPHLRHTFAFGEMALSYASGGADCAWVEGKDGKEAVCKFDSPGSLGVSVKGAPQVLYAPGIGHSAAIEQTGDKLACVITPRQMMSVG